MDIGSTSQPGRAPQKEQSLVQSAKISTTASSSRPCLHCNDRTSLTPYLYCGPCTQAAHRTAREAQTRNRLTQPPVKVYRWDTTVKKMVLKNG